MNFSKLSNRSIVGKIARLPLRALPTNLTVPILQGPLCGKLWKAGAGTHGCWLGSYESEKQKAISAELKTGDIVLDLGANVGFYSLLSSVRVGSVGKVFAFEPLPANLAKLKEHLALNRVLNTIIIEAAVASQDGTTRFDTSLHPSMGKVCSAAESGIAVRTVRLDTLRASGAIPRPTLIKCDIEGAEYDALMGARELLHHDRPVLFLATHGQNVHSDCIRLLTSLSYNLTPLEGADLNSSDELIARPR